MALNVENCAGNIASLSRHNIFRSGFSDQYLFPESQNYTLLN
jgi:hypothetical protein